MKTNLYKLITAATTEAVIFANQKGTQPDDPYIVIDIINVNSNFDALVSSIDANGNRTLTGNRDASIQLSAYGKDAYSRLDAVSMKLKTQSMNQLSDKLNVCIFRINEVKNAPLIIDELNYCERAILEISYRYQTTVSENISWIHEVGITGSDYKYTKPHDSTGAVVKIKWSK